jgi:hypothetical protein
MSLLVALAIVIDDGLRQAIGHEAGSPFFSGESRPRMPSEYNL